MLDILCLYAQVVQGNSETVVRRYSVKKLFLIFSQNSQESICASLFFNKVTDFIKMRLCHKSFPGGFCETSKNIFLWNACSGCF